MMVRTSKMLLTLFMLGLLVLGLAGCGDSGVDNGVITGTVFSNRSGGAATKTPEPSVSVVAVYQEEPQVIRNAVSDQNGRYTIPNLIVGKWSLGFSKDGFKTITASEKSDETTGATSAIGEGNIKLYVENGSTSPAPDVTLQQKPPEGDATVIINLVDNSTGERINGATITLGTATTSNSSNGQYVLVVPVTAPENGSVAQQPQTLVIAAEGYQGVAQGSDGQNSQLNVLAGQTVEYVISMQPKTGFIEGRLSLSKFEALYDITSFQVSIDGLRLDQNAAISGNGDFSIEVPVRTSTNNRSYTLRVTGRGILEQVVNNILAPQAGAVRVEVPPLTPETVTIVGQVIRPNTSYPVVVDGLGLQGGVTGGAINCVGNVVGSYSIDGVPVNTANQITLSATVFTCGDAQNPVLENPAAGVKSVGFTATNNGSGVFSAPTLGGSGGN